MKTIDLLPQRTVQIDSTLSYRMCVVLCCAAGYGQAQARKSPASSKSGSAQRPRRSKQDQQQQPQRTPVVSEPQQQPQPEPEPDEVPKRPAASRAPIDLFGSDTEDDASD